jgi:uncharacterized protein YgiM (DUF1202 family)
MRLSNVLIKLILLPLILDLAFSCVETQAAKPPEVPFYVTSDITYLLDRPAYGGNVLGPLYKGDKVERMDTGESDWWRVQLLRSGQVGWIRKELLSPEPQATVFYYVKDDSVPLLECPRSDCMSLQLLFRGEQVQRVEEGSQGWWRILVLKSRTLGWVPAAALTERIGQAQQKQLPKPYYYVAVRKLTLRAKPSFHGEAVRTLKFNEQVQKIGETQGWFKVRQPSSGAVGWIIRRDLETLPLIVPRGVRLKNEPKPFKQREEPQVEPEIM